MEDIQNGILGFHICYSLITFSSNTLLLSIEMYSASPGNSACLLKLRLDYLLIMSALMPMENQAVNSLKIHQQ